MRRRNAGGGTRQTDLGRDPIVGLVLKLAIPSMLAQLVNVAYSIVDRIYIGNLPDIGATALAGVGVCGPIVTLISSFAFLVGMGGAPLLAIKLGEGNHETAKRLLFNCAAMLTVVALLLTGTVFALKRNLLVWFGASERLLPYADTYLTWYAAGSLFAILAAGLNCFIICQGFSKLGMFTVLIGAALNIALDPLFIFVFDMSVAGAAIATVLSQFASCVFVLAVLFGKRITVRLGRERFSAKLCKRVLALGLSPFLIIATDSVLIIALNAVLQRTGGAQGDSLLACATVVLSFMQIVTMPLGGITSGTQPILSFNYGAKNSARIKSGERVILCACLVFTAVMFLFAQFGSAGFVRIFLKDEALVALTVRYIRRYTLCIIPLAFQYAFVDGLTALGIAKAAVSLSMFRKLVVMLTLTLVLPIFWGADAAFWAEPAADLVAGILSSVVFLSIINRILKKREAAEVLSDAEEG